MSSLSLTGLPARVQRPRVRLAHQLEQVEPISELFLVGAIVRDPLLGVAAVGLSSRAASDN